MGEGGLGPSSKKKQVGAGAPSGFRFKRNRFISYYYAGQDVFDERVRYERGRNR